MQSERAEKLIGQLVDVLPYDRAGYGLTATLERLENGMAHVALHEVTAWGVTEPAERATRPLASLREHMSLTRRPGHASTAHARYDRGGRRFA